MRIRTIALFGIAVAGTMLLLQGCYEERVVVVPPQPPPLARQDIVSMVKEGVPNTEIIRRIQESATVFRLSASDVEELKKQGVPDEVIDYMLWTREAPPTIIKRRVVVYDPWWGWDYFYGPGYWYYPVHFGIGFSYARFGRPHYHYGVHFRHWR